MSKSTKQIDIDLTLKRIFRKQAFRSVQREVIEVDIQHPNLHNIRC